MNRDDNDFNKYNNENYNNGLSSFDQRNNDFRNSINNSNYNNNNNNNQNLNYYPNMLNNNMYNNYVNKEAISSLPSKEKLRFGKVFFMIIVIFFILGSFFLGYHVYKEYNKKARTFMIYMVGSDLESKSKQGTYSISEIVGENIDLENNNVILMAGGSKKWHNFVDSSKIGIYKLTKDGFEKIDEYAITSMGNSDILSTFLNYSYKNYPAKKYDMIFWNHGLGALGIEQDEVANDYLTLSELNTAFRNSSFNNEKLELTIFYNCLSSNLQIAKIMKNYSNYMVASEEVFYLSKVLNRFNFLEQINKNDSPYNVGLSFIKQSDKVINSYNETHLKKLDSTLSIVNLSKIDELDKKLNEFINTIDLKDNYFDVSWLRSNLHTYGIAQSGDYDTVDLYELVNEFLPLSSNQEKGREVLDLIRDTVEYSSSLNDYSNGLSIYFPYYGKDSAIQLHLETFDKLWNDNYNNFIKSFSEIRMIARRDIRSSVGSDIVHLKNQIEVNNNEIELTLSKEELDKYKYANIYIFEKNNDENYSLVLKSNRVNITDNTLKFNNNKILKANNHIVSLIEKEDSFVYGTITSDESMDIIGTLDEKANIVEMFLDSGEYPITGLIEDEFQNISLNKLTYNVLENEDIKEDFEESVQKESIELDKDNLNLKFVDNDLKEYYVLLEVHDIYDDVLYSSLKKVEN